SLRSINVRWFVLHFLFLFCFYILVLFFFFFQAEDGIRDPLVTGVQTCALPILGPVFHQPSACYSAEISAVSAATRRRSACVTGRSEERRVGKECRSRGGPDG